MSTDLGRMETLKKALWPAQIHKIPQKPIRRLSPIGKSKESLFCAYLQTWFLHMSNVLE